jgi:predicted phosphodiesterase
MMKTAILSDIHGNLEAFDAVMSDLEGYSPDRIICLGDLIGYGPDPEEVIKKVAAREISCVRGNHEAALSSDKALNWLNFLARENNLATKALLSDRSLDFCASLPRSLSFEESCFVHGCPPDSILKYLYTLRDADITALVENLPENKFFVGHTHDLRLITVSEGEITRAKLSEGSLRLHDDASYFINVGSVGHPRDGNSKAKYVIWDSSDGTLLVRAIPYPAEVTAEKIVSRGFPRAYAICICPSFAQV